MLKCKNENSHLGPKHIHISIELINHHNSKTNKYMYVYVYIYISKINQNMSINQHISDFLNKHMDLLVQGIYILFVPKSMFQYFVTIASP